MKRGDILIVAPRPPFNKPRPAVVIQAAALDDTENVVMALITSDLSRIPYIRVPVKPTAENGLRKSSEVMIDMLESVPLDRIGGHAGTLELETMQQVDKALRMFLGLGNRNLSVVQPPS